VIFIEKSAFLGDFEDLVTLLKKCQKYLKEPFRDTEFLSDL
jgi:hypothetical protein